MIKNEGYEESESTVENIFSLSRLYGDEKTDRLMNELRIADEDRISFVKFIRDSISYEVASGFQVDYPMDNELLRENFSNTSRIIKYLPHYKKLLDKCLHIMYNSYLKCVCSSAG